jgi:hypothetical protein
MSERIGTIRIPSSDLETQAEGSVEMSAYVKRKHLPHLGAMQNVNVEVLKNDDASPEDRFREMRKFDEFLAVFVYDWDWKDQDGNPYPAPHQNPDAFGELRQEEWAWILSKANEIMAQEQGVPKANETP